jgi:hypothetical protein
MRVFWGIIVAACLWIVPVGAQQLFIYVPVGYQQIVSPVVATNLTIPTGTTPRIVEICVSAASIRYRDDGTAPTAAIGIPVSITTNIPTVCFQYSGNLRAIQFIGTGATIDVAYYR